MDGLVWIDYNKMVGEVFMIDIFGVILNKEEKGNGDYRPE